MRNIILDIQTIEDLKWWIQQSGFRRDRPVLVFDREAIEFRVIQLTLEFEWDDEKDKINQKKQ